MNKLLFVIKKLLLFIGGFVVVLFLFGAVTIGAVIFGKAPKCPQESGTLRNEYQLSYLIENGGLTIKDSEATSLIQKSLSEKIDDPRICFTPNLVHLSGNLRVGKFSPTFYISTEVDTSGSTPKTKNLDVKVGSIPNFFIFSPIEKMIEAIINDNLSQMKVVGKYSIEFMAGAATIKKVK